MLSKTVGKRGVSVLHNTGCMQNFPPAMTPCIRLLHRSASTADVDYTRRSLCRYVDFVVLLFSSVALLPVNGIPSTFLRESRRCKYVAFE